jgi:HSP20 family protein
MRHLTLWNDAFELTPWRGLHSLQRDFDRLFEVTTRDPKLDKDNSEVVFQPAVEMEETESHYLMNVDLPGVAKKDIQIELKNNQLHIWAERKNEKKTPNYSERYYGKFHRVFTLPEGLESEKIEAQYQDGVLSLAVPKAEASKPRQIKITEGKSSFFGKLIGGNKETENKLKDNLESQEIQ